MLIMPLQVTSTGIQPIISNNHGANQPQRARQTVYLGLIFTGLICLVEFALVLTYRESIPAMFLDAGETSLNLVGHGLLLVMLAFPVTGIQFIGLSFFQATDRASLAFITSIFRSLFFLVSLLILPRFLGLDGIFLSYPMTELVMAIIVGLMLIAQLCIKTQSQDRLLINS